MDKSCSTNEHAKRDTHPPGCQEAHYRGPHPFRQRSVNEAKLPKLEFRKVLWSHSVTDLIVNDAVKAAENDGEEYDEEVYA